MPQTNINIRTDENLKKQFDVVCSQMGLTLSAAVNIFMKTVVRQREIPFKVTADMPSFMVNTTSELDAKIARGLAELEAGKGRPAEEVFADLDARHSV